MKYRSNSQSPLAKSKNYDSSSSPTRKSVRLTQSILNTELEKKEMKNNIVEGVQVLPQSLNYVNRPYDTNSRTLRRYILEELLYIDPLEHVILLVSNLDCSFGYWIDIYNNQIERLPPVSIGDNTLIQIDVSVTGNARPEDFVSGQCDQDHIKNLVVGNGGVALIIEFYAKNTDPIELKACDL